jgi:hypothetical protein
MLADELGRREGWEIVVGGIIKDPTVNVCYSLEAGGTVFLFALHLDGEHSLIATRDEGSTWKRVGIPEERLARLWRRVSSRIP